MSSKRIFTPAKLAGVVSFCVAAAVSAQTPAPGTTPRTDGSRPAATAPAPSTTTGTPAGTAGGAPSSNVKAATLASGDRKFMEKAAQGGMAEVQLGKLAASKAQSDDVKKFAQRMADDHAKANDELKKIASSKNVTLPTEVDKSTQREMDKLQKLSGADFDREYMKHMVSDHKKDVSEFKSEASKAKDADLKQFASSTLPKLEEHLKLAQATEQTVKKEPRAAAPAPSGTTTKSGMATGKSGG